MNAKIMEKLWKSVMKNTMRHLRHVLEKVNVEKVRLSKHIDTIKPYLTIESWNIIMGDIFILDFQS